MKILLTKLTALFLISNIILTSCGNNNDSKNTTSQNLASGGSLVGKKYSGVSTVEGSTKVYIEIEFIDETVCTRFGNEYDVESDKFYNYPDGKKRFNYKRINNEIILTKEGTDGSSPTDVKKITISENNLIWSHGGQSMTLTTAN